MNKIINYFFDEAESKLIVYYSFLIKLIILSIIISVLVVVA